MLPATYDTKHPLTEKFRRFVARPGFPCVGAKAALGRNQLSFVVARDLGSGWDDLRIYSSLYNFASTYRPRRRIFQSFIVIFQGPRALPEKEFESCMWQRLQSLTDKDEWHGQRQDPAVSADPESPRFSLSFGGEAFFCVGLHPKASRPARRFGWPALVFNLHDQFERMRKDGLYEKLRATILQRDERLSGTVNPMLARYGEESEARQYGGALLEAGWKCPFHRERIYSAN